MWILLVLGCNTPVGSPLQPCASRDQADCDGACAPVSGFDCDEPDANVYVGCIERGQPCNDITWGCRPDDDSSGCVRLSARCDYDGASCPDGWSSCFDDPSCPSWE